MDKLDRAKFKANVHGSSKGHDFQQQRSWMMMDPTAGVIKNATFVISL